MADKTQLPCCIPASPNWYCSGSASCIGFGYYAFVARNSVYLVNLQDSFSTCKDVFQLQKARVNSVCLLSVDTAGHVIGASGTEDYSVKIWNGGTKRVFKEHRKHQVHKDILFISNLFSP